MHKGLEETAALFPPVRAAFAWVHRVARLLANHDGEDGGTLKKRLQKLLGQMQQQVHQAATAGDQGVADGLSHFLKVSESYEPGLFYCYDDPDVPRTNNGLEQAFGSHRHHERRATGRKGAAPGLAVRGPVRLVAGMAARLRQVGGQELAPRDLERWRELRRQLERRREARCRQRRFRRDPAAYLGQLEERFHQLGLPP